MEKKYEITIRELTPFSEEERKEAARDQRMRGPYDLGERKYADEPFHEVRVLFAQLSKEEFEEVKKAVIKVA